VLELEIALQLEITPPVMYTLAPGREKIAPPPGESCPRMRFTPMSRSVPST
jgi:hypothetical protein